MDRAAFARLLVPGALVALLMTEWLILLGRSFATGMGQDFTTLYVAALSWLHGHDPYASDAPARLAAALHVRYQGELELPLLLPLAAPLTMLPPRVAFILYALVQDALIAGGSLLLAASLGVRRRWLLVLALVASPSAFLVGYYGQVAALVYCAAAGAWWARYRGRGVTLGLCVAAACLKPQLGLCVGLPLLWGWSPTTRAGRRAWLGLLCGGLLLLGGVLLVEGPAGFVGYLHILRAASASHELRANTDGLGATALYGGWLSPRIAVVITPVVTVALALGAIVVAARRRGRSPSSTAAMLTVLFTLMLPYSHQYDSIVVFPALLIGALDMPPGRAARLLRYAAVPLIVATPLSALSAVPVPFRLLPLGLALWLLSSVAPARPLPVSTMARET